MNCAGMVRAGVVGASTAKDVGADSVYNPERDAARRPVTAHPVPPTITPSPATLSLDPTLPHRLPIATGTDMRFISVCNEGYSSRLATATLDELGLQSATDLLGGFQAWRT